MQRGQWSMVLGPCNSFPCPSRHSVAFSSPKTLSEQPNLRSPSSSSSSYLVWRSRSLPNPSAKAEYIVCFHRPPPLSMSHHPHLRFLFSVAFSALFLPCAICDAEDPFYDFCQTNAKCGDIEIRFPFGIQGDRYGCGDPHFRLFCLDGHLAPLLQIGTNNYTIFNTSKVGDFNNDHRITIVNAKAKPEIDRCDPRAYSIDQWDYSDFNIASQYGITTFFGDCTSPENPSLRRLNCGDDWYYSGVGASQNSNNFGCKTLVEVPVPPNFLDSGNFDLLAEGFEIIWSYHHETRNRTCSGCVWTGGYCGYNISDSNFLCLCKDGQQLDKCRNDGSSKNAAVAAIGYSIAGVAVIAIVILLVFFYRRRKSAGNRRLVSDIRPDQSKDLEGVLPGHRTGDWPFFGNLPVFSYEELREATDGFAEKNELGDGGFGSVYLGRLWDGRAVAVKRLYQDNSKRLQQFMNEVELFSSLHHRNLVRLFGCSSPDSPELLLVYEYVPNGTLADHLHGERKGKGLFWNTRLNIAIETAQALAFLHGIEPPIYHRDVKSSNILLDEDFTVKLADFGLSRLVPLDVTHVTTAPQGTPGYLDPDYHQCYQLTEKSDVYSFGVVLLEIISAKLAVDINRNRREISLANMAVAKIRSGALHELVDPSLEIETNHSVKVMVSGVAELALGCLAAEKDDRPHMQEVVAQLEQIKQMGYVACPDKQPGTPQ